ELIGLAITIRDAGQLVPIRLRKDGDGYAIVDGHRRYEAMRLLKRAEIAAIVDPELDDSESLTRQWISNCQRAEISILDRSRTIQQLMNQTGWSPTETSKHLGVAPAVISRAVAMLSLPEPIVAQIERGELPPSTAIELSKITDRERQQQLADAAANGQATRDE